jgi:hypothetical protein
MKKIVNFCGNCPFLYSDYDPDCVGYSTIDICQLARFLNQNPDHISVHDECGFNTNSKTPDWCPLKKEQFTIEFREFSNETKLAIENVKKEIAELEGFFDDSVEYDSPIYTTKTEQLQQAYNKLIEFESNIEEKTNIDLSSFGKEFNENINNQIDEIKSKLSYLDNAGNKLQEILTNIGKNENRKREDECNKN